MTTVLAEQPAKSTRPDSDLAMRAGRVLSLEICVALLYGVVVLAAVMHHEPWADEAQSWLLARDASLVELWSKLLRLEGTPGLWHSLLHLLIALRMPYAGMNVVSAIFGLAGAIVIVRCAPFPLVLRLALPFTYFLCFQYAVVARSYSLAPVILFSLAALYRSSTRRWLTVTLLLMALAAVSAQGFILSVAVALTFARQYASQWKFIDLQIRRHLARAAVGYGVFLTLMIWAVWPAHSATFASASNWSAVGFAGVFRYGFRQAFGDDYWPLVIVGLSLPWLSRGPGLWFFSSAVLALCGFGSVVYSNVWHHGFLVLVWLFALWISPIENRLRLPALAALLCFIGLQCTWTWKAVRYDWTHAYSGSQTMVGYLKEHKTAEGRIVGIGFPLTALQPYFASTPFVNHPPSNASYWVWSKRVATNDAIEQLGATHPEFVLIGYGNEIEHKLWDSLAIRSGYERVAHSEGATFWQTEAFQSENFELLRARARPRDSVLLSDLNMRLPETGTQLLSGFLDGTTEQGRWVGRGASLDLQRPPSFASHGGTLEIEFSVPEEQIRINGPLKLVTYVSGRRLPAMNIGRSGQYRYSQPVSSADLFWAITPVSLQFVRGSFTLQDVEGERVALVSRIALVAR